MKYKFFSIPAQNPLDAENRLNAFCAQHRVGFVEKHLIADGAESYWVICVTWHEGEDSLSTGGNKKLVVDYKQVLSEADFSLYLELRNFRKALAEQHAVPVYALFTNEQLAAMIQNKVANKAGLQNIAGVGNSRINKFGDDFLQKLNELWTSTFSTGHHEKDSN